MRWTGVCLLAALAAEPAAACNATTGIGCAASLGGRSGALGGVGPTRNAYGIGVNKDAFGRLTQPTDPRDPIRSDAFDSGLNPGSYENSVRCNSAGAPEGCK